MRKRQRIYLDVCSLNRFFDDQTQDRVRLETEALLVILRRIQNQEDELVASEAVDLEVEQDPDRGRQHRIRDILRLATYPVTVGERVRARLTELTRHGMGTYDALHLACAEAAHADVLLTTDDDFVKRAARSGAKGVRVCNPLRWLAQNEVGR
jgi:predicted nucleic acid-binding protein